MITAIKVFTILGMITLCWLIFPIVIGIITLKKLDVAKSKSELTTLAIVNIFFVSTIGGILLLLVNDADLPANANNSNQ